MCTNTEEILSKSSNSVLQTKYLHFTNLFLQIGLFLLTGIPNKESISAIDHYMVTLGTPQNKQN